MAKSKSNSMSDFLVTFFVGDRAISRMLSDVLKNRNNPLFLETLGLPSDFAIPFSQEEAALTKGLPACARCYGR